MLLLSPAPRQRREAAIPGAVERTAAAAGRATSSVGIDGARRQAQTRSGEAATTRRHLTPTSRRPELLGQATGYVTCGSGGTSLVAIVLANQRCRMARYDVIPWARPAGLRYGGESSGCTLNREPTLKS